LMKRKIRVRFQPEGRLIRVPPGSTILEAAHAAGLVLKSPCGGHGLCGHCRVMVKGELQAASPTDRKHLSESELKAGFRLACQTRLYRDTVIVVPRETRLAEQKILEKGLQRRVRLRPAVEKIFARVARAELATQMSDEERLLLSLPPRYRKVRLSVPLLRDLPTRLRRADHQVTAVVYGGKVIGLEEGDTRGKMFGLAFDIGTTTVVGTLVDLVSGREIRTASRTNPQVVFGDDVISRIDYAGVHKEGLERLHTEVTRAMNEIIEEVSQGIDRDSIYDVTVVGNSTMTHLFLKICPRYLAQSPYVGSYKEGVEVSAAEVGLALKQGTPVYVLPSIAAFVGADTVGLVLASALHKKRGLCMAIDIGTNGEVVLGDREKMLAVSCAAGPAFEGVRIKFGMRAMPGAVERVCLNEDLEISVIGGRAPSGICGSGIVDLMGEMVRTGVLDETGRLLGREALTDLPEAIKRRVVRDSSGGRFILADEGQTESGRTLYVTQKDIREVQLAKAAISAGIEILLKEYGAGSEDLEAVYLAGAFGNYIRKEQARRLGILPDVPLEKVKFIGNAAHSGAKLALISRKMREEAKEISRKVRYVELAGRSDFQMTFADSMLFKRG